MRTTGKATDLITFSRSSGGTALRKIAYGPELVTNGTFDSDATGATPATWETNNANASLIKQADGAALFSSTSFAYARIQNASRPVLPTGLYKVSFDISEWATGLLNVHVGLGAGGNIVTGNGSYSYIFESTAEQAYEFQLRPNSGGTGSFKIDNISVKEVLFDQGDLTLFNHPADIPRIEYDANGNVLGLLVEESRVNLIVESNDFSTQNAIRSTATDNSALSPDGTSNAARLQDTTAAGDHRLDFTSFAVTSGTAYTFSVYAKAAELSWIRVWFSNDFGTAYGNFDLSSGTVGTVTGLNSSSIEDIGNGWYRCSITATATASASNVQRIQLGVGDNQISFTGDGASGVYLYGAQVEAGAFPTSYIPTSGSTATRAADVASIATSEFGYRDDEGTVVVEAQLQIKDVSYKAIANINTDGNNRIRIISGIYPTVIQSEIRNGGVGQFAQSENITEGAPFKAALAYKENNTNSSVSGSVESTDTACTIPDVVRLDIMTAMTGHIKSIKYIPRRLTNDQLVEITS